MTARYTFFELATQNGYVVAQMAPRMRKGRFGQIIIDPSGPGTGRLFQMFKESNPETPEFRFFIPDRQTTESTVLWEHRCKRELDKAWADYERDREAQKRPEAGANGSGTGTTGPSDLKPSNPTPSSTEPPPLKSESSDGASREAETVSPPSDPSPPPPPSRRSRSSSKG